MVNPSKFAFGSARFVDLNPLTMGVFTQRVQGDEVGKERSKPGEEGAVTNSVDDVSSHNSSASSVGQMICHSF